MISTHPFTTCFMLHASHGWVSYLVRFEVLSTNISNAGLLNDIKNSNKYHMILITIQHDTGQQHEWTVPVFGLSVAYQLTIIWTIQIERLPVVGCLWNIFWSSKITKGNVIECQMHTPHKVIYSYKGKTKVNYTTWCGVE